MKRYKLSELKRYVIDGLASDITDCKNPDEMRCKLECIGVSFGTCGMNGALFKDNNTGALYVITARNTTLFIMV